MAKSKLTHERVAECLVRCVREARSVETRPSDQDLTKLVIKAASEIGIPEVEAILPDVPNSWTAVNYGIIIRQPKFVKEKYESLKDIGYIKRGQFYYNPFAFTDERLNQFLEALERNGVDADEHHDFGPIFYTEYDFKRWEQREEKAFYR